MKWLAFALVQLLVGCVAYPPIEVKDLPHGSGQLGEAELSTYLFMSGDRQDDLDLRALWHAPLDDVLHRELERSGYFAHLHYLNERAPPLKLHVWMKKTSKRDTAAEFGVPAAVVVLGGGSIPRQVDWRYEASFTVRCRSEVIGKWSYELAATELSSIWGPKIVGKNMDERAVISFVPRFLEDAAARAALIGACR